MKVDDREWPRIWCDVCGQPQPVLTDLLEALPAAALTPPPALEPGQQGEGAIALDLVCTVCRSIVATLHDAPAPAGTPIDPKKP